MGEFPPEPPPGPTVTNTWLLISVNFTFGLGLFMGELLTYGWSLFVIFPLIVGLSAGLMPFKKYKMLGVYLGLAAFLAILLFGHYEDIVCIIFALPLTLAMIVVGYMVGYYLAKKKYVKPNRLNVIVLPLLFFGLTTLLDRLFGNSYQEQAVSTSLYLPYSPETVFDKIKSVDTLDTDKPFFMSLGLPAPQKCVLESETVGAKRTCYFEGGIIEEKVTEIKRGEVLKMKVTKYTLPGLKWLRFKDAIYYFRPERNGTVITRVTTYFSSLKPRFYWSWCERSAIESEHEYVLRNLKKDLQNNKPVAPAQDTLKKIHVSEDFDIIPLSENAYVHSTWTSTPTFGRFNNNGLIYINGNEAMIMNTPPDDRLSKELLDWFSKTFPSVKIKAVVCNHFHADGIGGLRVFHDAGIPSYANAKTNAQIKSDTVVKPQHTFTEVLEMQVNGKTVRSQYFGESHTPDIIVTWLPDEKILYGGCMIKALGAGRGFTGDANLKQWSATVARVKKAFPDAKFVIPGHGDCGGAALLDFTIKMFAGDAK
jgi:glyoxylase-like metal-dependent hydrolase (beta-lactamase superfamily II)